jgi:hypothetical protein
MDPDLVRPAVLGLESNQRKVSEAFFNHPCGLRLFPSRLIASQVTQLAFSVATKMMAAPVREATTREACYWMLACMAGSRWMEESMVQGPERHAVGPHVCWLEGNNRAIK